MKPHNLSEYDRKRVAHHIDTLIATGRLSKLPLGVHTDWATRAFVVDSPGKGILGRLVCTFVPLNNMTVKSAWPIPSVNHIFAIMAGSVMFSTMDAVDGFYRVQPA
jgi:hypothetical protein